MLKVNVKIGDSPRGVRREKMDPPDHQHSSLDKGFVLIPTVAIANRVLGEHTRVTDRVTDDAQALGVDDLADDGVAS